MCKYCEDGAFNTLIENEVEFLVANIWGKIHIWDEPDIQDMSVVMEIRNGAGYIRLGDRGEMNCIDHENKIQINFCPMCGKELKQ